MNEQLEKVIHLVEESDLDRTIKDIIIRDLQTEGLSDFLKEQIRVYCLDGLKKLDAQMAETGITLDDPELNPSNIIKKIETDSNTPATS